jgi:hypothetical protein
MGGQAKCPGFVPRPGLFCGFRAGFNGVPLRVAILASADADARQPVYIQMCADLEEQVIQM